MQPAERAEARGRLLALLARKPGKYVAAAGRERAVLYCADPLKALGELGVRVFANGEGAKRDIVPRTYEGGFKVWECELRGVEALEGDDALAAGARVAEIGCGAGLVGLCSLQRGAAHVLFQDYNQDVLDFATSVNVELNLGPAAGRAQYLACGWAEWAAELERAPLPEQLRFDLVFGADILYETEHYPVLVRLLCQLLKARGRAVIVSKVFYFGNTGDVAEFCAAVSGSRRLELEREAPIADPRGSAKTVLFLRRRP